MGYAQLAPATSDSPIVFDGCFGWYHHGSSDLGVVLCAPHGHEELCAHRHWRELARTLADRGLPTLRFDYPGTGDSAEDEESPGRVSAWIGSIGAAAATLRRTAGVDRIALVGLRIGALLAAAAAEEIEGVTALALLAPMTSGEACVRELRVLTKMAAAKRQRDMYASESGAGRGGLEPAGFLYTDETLADLRALSLPRSGRQPADSILLLDRPSAAPDQDFRDRLGASGARLEAGIFEDYALLLRDPGLSAYPERSFGRLVDWLAGLAGTAARHAPCAPTPGGLGLPEAEETPVIFHHDPALFGVLCTPQALAPRRPTLVFVNTGANHHIGMGRMSVTMARRFAASGFASFRFDIGGVGDSDPPAGRDLNHPTNPATAIDVAHALDWLQSRGHRDFILIGLCSGAKLALHTTLRDTRVVGQLLLNLQGFWRAADPANQYLSRRAYARLALRPATWKRVFRGEINVRGIVKSVIGRAAAGVSADLREAVSQAQGRPGKRGASLADFRNLAMRRVRTHFVYVEEDPGVDEMEMMFGRDGWMLAGIPNVSMTFLREGDHVFSSERARRRLFAEVEQAATRMTEPLAAGLSARMRMVEPDSPPSTAPSFDRP